MSLSGDNIPTARPSALNKENVRERIHSPTLGYSQQVEVSRGWRQKAEMNILLDSLEIKVDC